MHQLLPRVLQPGENMHRQQAGLFGRMLLSRWWVWFPWKDVLQMHHLFNQLSCSSHFFCIFKKKGYNRKVLCVLLCCHLQIVQSNNLLLLSLLRSDLWGRRLCDALWLSLWVPWDVLSVWTDAAGGMQQLVSSVEPLFHMPLLQGLKKLHYSSDLSV